MAAGGFSLFSPPSLWKLGIFEGEAEADDRNALYLDKTARGKGAALTEREKARYRESSGMWPGSRFPAIFSLEARSHVPAACSTVNTAAHVIGSFV